MKITDTSELVFETYSGSVYHIRSGKIRRLNASAEKRADGLWVPLYILPELWIGAPAYLVMESLSGFGPDDSGQVGDLTTRITSEVVGIDVPGDEEVPF